MNFVFNPEPLYAFLLLPADQLLIRLLTLYGWIPFAFLFMMFLWEWYQYENGGRWGSKQKFILLAIDVPKGNEQSPMAVENMITYLAGAHSALNIIDMYVDGKFQLCFSFEIVSIGGYTQFIIHTPVDFRNLVESAVYSQYPDAEITEIQDYTTGFPTTYPNEEYDLWGSELIPATPPSVMNPPWILPIRTYKEFEHQFGKPEFTFRDPMASLMDLCSTLRKGENFWFQILIKPTNTDWTKLAKPATDKLMGVEAKSKNSALGKFADMIVDLLFHILYIPFGVAAEPAKEKVAKKMMDLLPVEKKKVEAIQLKVAKLGFECKLRVVYIARKDVINKPKVVNGFMGFVKQFGDNDLSAWKPDSNKTGTSTAFFAKDARVNARKGRIIRAYQGRSMGTGSKTQFLNIEELATLWHFPIEASVRAPLIQKTPGKKAEPPNTLPIGEDIRASAGMLDDIFVMEQPSVPPPAYQKQDENIFSFEMEEESARGPQNGSSETAKENYSDIFSVDDAPVAKTATQENDKGGPPSNLPFA